MISWRRLIFWFASVIALGLKIFSEVCIYYSRCFVIFPLHHFDAKLNDKMAGLSPLKTLNINVYFAWFQSVWNNNHTVLILIFLLINWTFNREVKKEFIDRYIKNVWENLLSLKFAFKLKIILSARFHANK